jgi:hypothetical protein
VQEKIRSPRELVDRILDIYSEVLESFATEEMGPTTALRLGLAALEAPERSKVLLHSASSALEQMGSRVAALVQVILASLAIKPREELASNPRMVVFESDLHGDLYALLSTLLRAGMVEFARDNPIGILFYDPEEDRAHSLANLAEYRDSWEGDRFRELLWRLQLLPSVVPRESYGRYINCGDLSDRGGQSEQVIFLLLRLQRLYRRLFPHCPAPRLMVGNHENFYIVNNKSSILNAVFCGASHTFATDFNISVDGASPRSEARLRNIARAIRLAVGDGTLRLAHSIGRTIFSHALITREMLVLLSRYFASMAAAVVESPLWEDPEDRVLKNKVQDLALKFGLLANLLSSGRELGEEQIGGLVGVLNEFNVLRVELIERQERIGGANALEWETYNPNLLPGEREMIEIMNGSYLGMDHRASITWQRRSLETKEKDLIPGVKYILGHDPSEDNRRWTPAPEIGGRIVYIDSFRSSGYSGGLTAAHYFAAEESFFGGEERFREKQAPVLSELEMVTPREMEFRALENFRLQLSQTEN